MRKNTQKSATAAAPWASAERVRARRERTPYPTIDLRTRFVGGGTTARPGVAACKTWQVLSERRTEARRALAVFLAAIEDGALILQEDLSEAALARADLEERSDHAAFDVVLAAARRVLRYSEIVADAEKSGVPMLSHAVASATDLIELAQLTADAAEGLIAEYYWDTDPTAEAT